MFTKYTSVIIPTRNRSNQINKLLAYFIKNDLSFNQVLIVDSSDNKKNNFNTKALKKLKVKVINSYPSASHQRNLGLTKVKKNSHLVLFLDDDVIFYDSSFKEMNKLINKINNINNIAGIAFNLIASSKENLFLKRLKDLDLLKKLNIFSSLPGKVMQSGWHTKIENIKKDTYVQWLFSGATIYKKKLIKHRKFNETLGAYSYLEDLFFSYGVYRDGYKLLVSKNAKFKNPNFVERSNFKFGVKEILNRYKFVCKFRLNFLSFFLLSFLRFFLSFVQIFKFKLNYLLRSLGNIFALLQIIFKKNEK